MTKLTLRVQKRIATDKNNNLRKQGLVPANIYGLGEKSEMVNVNQTNLKRLFRDTQEVGLIYLQEDEDKREIPVLVEEIQQSALKGDLLHVSFKRVNLNQKVHAEVSIELSGEFKIPNAVVVLVKDSIEVEALPADLPEKFVVDVSKFTAIGDSFHVGALQIDRSKVTILSAADDESLVIVQEVKEAPVEETPAVSEGAEEVKAADSAAGKSAPATDKTDKTEKTSK